MVNAECTFNRLVWRRETSWRGARMVPLGVHCRDWECPCSSTQSSPTVSPQESTVTSCCWTAVRHRSTDSIVTACSVVNKQHIFCKCSLMAIVHTAVFIFMNFFYCSLVLLLFFTCITCSMVCWFDSPLCVEFLILLDWCLQDCTSGSFALSILWIKTF